MGLGHSSATADVPAAASEVHVVGDAFVDILATDVPAMPDWGGDVNASGIYLQAGGAALNFAVHLESIARASVVVHFHGCVGKDTSAIVLRNRLKEVGVRDRLVTVTTAPTGSCMIISGHAERSFVTCSGATAAMTAADILPGLVESVRNATRPVHLHFGGFCSYGNFRYESADLVKTLREQALKVNVPFTVSADINGSEAEHIAGFQDLLEQLDIYKGNKVEAEAVAGVSGIDAVKKLAIAARRAAVVTDGPNGAHFFERAEGQESADEVGHVDAFRPKIVDTTGAGDACGAGLIASWLRGESLAHAVKFGCAAGSLNCSHIGGCATPVTTEEINALINEVKAQ